MELLKLIETHQVCLKGNDLNIFCEILFDKSFKMRLYEDLKGIWLLSTWIVNGMDYILSNQISILAVMRTFSGVSSSDFKNSASRQMKFRNKNVKRDWRRRTREFQDLSTSLTPNSVSSQTDDTHTHTHQLLLPIRTRVCLNSQTGRKRKMWKRKRGKWKNGGRTVCVSDMKRKNRNKGLKARHGRTPAGCW